MSLSEFEKWLKEKKAKKRKVRKLSAFLAVKDEVVSCLSAGYEIKTVYEYLIEKGKLDCHYETFRLHVKNYISNEEIQKSQPDNSTVQTRKKTQKQSDNKPSKLEKFNFDPNPNDDELF